MPYDQEAPVPNIPEVPPGPAPSAGAQTAARRPTVKAAKAALTPPQLPSPEEAGIAGELSPEQAQIIQIVLNDPIIMSAIANALGVGPRPEEVLFGG